MLFSERKRIGVRDSLQIEEMDDRLRNRIWSAFYQEVWLLISEDYYQSPDCSHAVADALWAEFFAMPIDESPIRKLTGGWDSTLAALRAAYMELPWHRVYDFCEFVLASIADEWFNVDRCWFAEALNRALSEEQAGYRIVGDEVTDILQPEQIEAIEQAAMQASSLGGVWDHLNSALVHLSDREQPDYDNSVKESISAVEGLAQLIIGDDHSTLGQALGVIEEHVRIHPCLKIAFDKLYGYSCDEDHVRHGSFRSSDVAATEARFMLVACSAFVSYLIDKSTEAGIDLAERASPEDTE